MDVLVDVGNTRLKWGIERDGEIRCSTPLTHREADFWQKLETVWRNLEGIPQRLALASVASPELLQGICRIAGELWPHIEIIRAHSQSCAYGVENAYRMPQKLGVDRWLCLLAAHRYHKLPACIVDCGTAVTVDVIDAQGIHRGGVIAPGLQLMKQSLQTGTQQLQFCSEHYPLGLSCFTEAAVYSGTLYACIGLIERIWREQRQKPQVLLTGGDAETVVPYLSFPVKVQTDLVLQGLSVLLENSS
ncbi:MAG: type III pantothenate kinase [Gammaproteobacteria bacterium]